MAHAKAAQNIEYEVGEVLYIAFELSAKQWKVRCSKGGRQASETTIPAKATGVLLKFVSHAKQKLGLPEDAAVLSCMEAGRDGFWVHRYVEELGFQNVIIDAASVEVSRHKRRAKTDKLDVRKLLTNLVRFHRGDDDVWRVVHVPSEQDEDDRRLHRELERLKNERTQHRNRVWGLQATQGVSVVGSLMVFLKVLDRQRMWNGQALLPGLKAELEREHRRLLLVEEQIKSIEKEQRERVKTGETEKIRKVAKLRTLRGIGLDSAWLLTMEHFGWRQFNNRREVGASVGLAGTPFDSGQMVREQGISKAGNARMRERMVELAWLWVRLQPDSTISVWFHRRFPKGGKRARKVGITAVARRLLIQLWHFVEHDIEPPGAIIVNA